MPTKKTGKKIKNVLIISASFRPNSNSHALCQEVAKGVKAAGNKAEVIRLKDKKIGFCTVSFFSCTSFVRFTRHVEYPPSW